MADVGYWALVLTFFVSVYAAIVALLGTRQRNPALLESARNGAFAAAATATVSAAVLLYLLLSRDLSIKYVFEHVNSYLPTVYRVSALWAGQEGSLLVWLWLVTLFNITMILWKRAWSEPFAPYVLVVMAVTQAFLALVVVLLSNPFETLPSVPVEGLGLNPLLQNFWMVIHPPVIFLGYAAYTVPFALAIGGLASGRLGKTWLALVRRWALVAWLVLGMGILMGAYWAYLELGWGGYWGWDPVENSSLIPWLTGTALLHSLMMQRRRDAFVTWNLWLISLTFVLCMFATFVTRSGIIDSVHAFGRSSIGYYFLGFIALCLLALVLLLSLRRRALCDSYDFRTLLSREASLLLTNLFLVGAALIVLVGTLFPALVDLVQGRQAALDVSFYERTIGPLALMTILLVGICPWLAWGGVSSEKLRRKLLPSVLVALVAAISLVVLGIREPLVLLAGFICVFVGISLLITLYQGTLARRRGSGEGIPRAFLRSVSSNRRRYGAHIVHLGIMLMAVGVTGSTVYQDEVQVALAPGESTDVHGYTLEYQDLVSDELPGQESYTAFVDVHRGDRQLDTLRPKQDYYWNIEQWVTEVAIRSTLKEDLYVILAGFDESGLASFRVLVNPLVVWLWIGGVALLLGGIMAWWPAASERNGK